MNQTTQDGNAASETVDNVTTQEQTQDNLDADNVSAKNSVSYETNRRNVGKIKNLQAKLNDTETRLARFEEDKLESEGKKDELITQLRQRLNETESELKEKNASFAYTTIAGQVEREAVKMGCQDTELLLMAINSELETFEVDSAYKVSSDQVKGALERVKKTKPFLFSKPQPNVQDGIPTTPEAMPTGEEAYKKEIRGAKTQQEFDAIRKKYNKYY